MAFQLEAACYGKTGRVRKINEDNFFFDDRCLEPDNRGLRHPVTMSRTLDHEVFLAVFDGMGGEDFGNLAAFAAADSIQRELRKPQDYFIPERRFLGELCRSANDAVVGRARELCTRRMGTTMAALYFSYNCVYVCNLGDSRAYRLRESMFLQLSEDHVEKRGEETEKKAPLTQYLGIDPEEMLIEPYIAKGELRAGDQYLLCSDGLTDMLTNLEIDDILCRSASAEECVQGLIRAALDRGGRDNVTAIVCRVHK